MNPDAPQLEKAPPGTAESAPRAGHEQADADAARLFGRARTCVGCGDRFEPGFASDVVRLVVSPQGEIAVDARGGGFGRGAHVHARPECLRRAVERGLARSAKARVHTLQVDAANPDAGAVPLTVRSLAQAIQRAMDRRIEGLLLAAARSKHVALGADAVTSASMREDAALVLVATDAAAGAGLTAVRVAVSEGRAASWGSKEGLGELLSYGGASRQLAVLAITSASIAGSLLDAVRVADACAAVVAGQPVKSALQEPARRVREKRSSPLEIAESGTSPSVDACAPAQDSGKLGTYKGDAAPRGDGAHRDRSRQRGRGGEPRMAERAPTEKRGQEGQRAARDFGQRTAKPVAASAGSQGTTRAAGRPHVGRGSASAGSGHAGRGSASAGPSTYKGRSRGQG